MTKADYDLTAGSNSGSSSPLSKEGKAMARLRDWRDRPLWSGARNPIGPLPWPEGVCVLAGIDPEASADADPTGWALLPGALEFYGFKSFPKNKSDAMQLGASAQVHIGYLLGLGLRTAAPDRWIDHVQRKCIAIPWQEALIREAQRNRRREQHNTSGAERLLQGMGRDTFNEARNSNFAGLRKSNGRPNQSMIAEKVLEAMWVHVGEDEPEDEVYQLDTVRKRVAEWLKEDKA